MVDRINRKDFLIASFICLVSIIIVVIGNGQYGISWDEADPNFPTIIKQANWIKSVLTHSESYKYLFSDQGIYDYWFTKSDHPSLSRSIAAVSYLLFKDSMGEIRSIRIPSAIYFSLIASLLYLWGTKVWGRVAGWAAVLSFFMMPRLFGHGHLAGLDIAITFWWVAVAMAFSWREFTWRWSIVIAVLYVGALATKLHSLFLPFPLLIYIFIPPTIFSKGSNNNIPPTPLVKGGKMWWKPFLLMGIIGSIGYLILQPWLWHHTFSRLFVRFFHYSDKATSNPIPLWYWGHIYSNDTPWHYPIVMVMITVPAAILVCFLWYTIRTLKNPKKEHKAVFVLLNFITPLLIITLPLAQGYDGIRLFLPAFPFIALLAGAGFADICRVIPNIIWKKRNTFHKQMVFRIVLFALVFLPIAWNLFSISPFHLAYYNELIGGIPGAKKTGMETVYWCETLTPEFLEEINQRLFPGSRVKTLAMPLEPLLYYQKLGLLRKDITIGGKPPYDFHILQARQGMFGKQGWYFYNKKPISEVSIYSVPLIQLHGRRIADR